MSPTPPVTIKIMASVPFIIRDDFVGIGKPNGVSQHPHNIAQYEEDYRGGCTTYLPSQ